MTESYQRSRNVVDITGDGEQVSREELFARQSIQELRPFPELEIRLIKLFGPGGEMVMLHQLIYWFGKPKMQNRWTLYKTFEEWREERGLNRKQVDRARKRLAPTGIVEEKYGPYKRVHYRLNWARLREVLDGGRLYPLKGGQSMTVPPLGESVESVPPLGGSVATVPPQTDAAAHSHAGETPEEGGSVATVPPQTDAAPPGNRENPPNRGGQSNTGTYAGEYLKNPGSSLLSEETLFQSGDDAFSSRPSPPRNKEFLPTRQTYDGAANPTTSSGGQPELDPELLSEVREVLSAAPSGNAAEVFHEYRREKFDSVRVMEAVSREMKVQLCEELRRHIREAMQQVEEVA